MTSDFGAWTSLRIIRERSGMSLGELAARAGLSRPHLSNLENGKRWPSANVIVTLAVALNVLPSMIERSLDDQVAVQ